MPTIEMMACGGAVLASTAGAVAETAPRAHLIDPLDEGGWRSAMLRAATDDDWVRSLRAGVERHAARFTWEACAAATLAAYEKVLAAAGRPAA